jgi:hypothetical protein
MTQRDRQTPEAGVPTAPPPPAGPALRPPADIWDETYLRATLDERQRLLALSQEQGLLYAHQLPANGTAHPSLLNTLLNGPAPTLTPLRTSPYEPLDRHLDAVQCEAAARALHTPDICLIQGGPGTGKSRVVVEILAAAAGRGERVLFVAPTAAALDRVLEPLAAVETVCPIRVLGADEGRESLPVPVRRLTLEQRVHDFRTQTLGSARQVADLARAASTDRAAETDLWPRLEDLAAQHEELTLQAQQLEARRRLCDDPATDPADDAPPTYREVVGEVLQRGEEEGARLQDRLRAVRHDLEKARGEQAALSAELDRVRPQVDARRQGRWWTGPWWSGLFRKTELARFDDLERSRDELASTVAGLEQQCAALAGEVDQAAQRTRAEHDRLRADERARQHGELSDRLDAVAQEQRQLRDKWEATRRDFRAGAAAPTEPVRAAVRDARSAWQQARNEALARRVQAEQCLRDMEEALPTLARRLADCATVVAATTAALGCDAHFGDASGRTFDLLVLEEAGEVTESEFRALARRAPRWVLVGEPSTDEVPAGRPAPARSPRPVMRPGLFQRLWRSLHADPRQLPYRWHHRAGRVVCRLRPVPPDQERWLQTEYVADRPEIELRIIAPPRQASQLAEVTFPATVTPAEAKEFIYRELQEAAIQAAGTAQRWEEGPDRLVLHLAATIDPAAIVVSLESGISERVHWSAGAGGLTCHTIAVEFDRAAGWSRDRSEQWAAEYLGLADPGRTAWLTAPHRAAPELAHFVADLLQDGVCHALPLDPAAGACQVAPVTFVAVPPQASFTDGGHRSNTEGRRRQGGTATAPRPRVNRGGAGFESNLAEVRRLDPLPADLRAALPPSGLVNWFEAQAVVRTLEALAADTSFTAAAAAWQSACGCCAAGCRRPAVAVMALYSAQAELLARLIQRSPILGVGRLGIEVGHPSAFRQRECFAAFVSLTRSHTHRAVPYGDSPLDLTLALTRATGRLYLFGDPGTLARRCQWQGALDHLDDVAGSRERGLMDSLLGYLHGHGPHPTVFRRCEGSGP